MDATQKINFALSHGVTVADIARESGRNWFTVKRIHRGETPNPGVKTVEEISAAIDRLLKDKGESCPSV